LTSSQRAPAPPGSEFDVTRLRHWFLAAVIAMLALRLAFAATVPLTSDEAYFASWALHPDFGYFDHPPMVAWWLTPLTAASMEPWVLRLPAVLVPTVVSLTVTGLLRQHDQTRAYLTGLALALVPVEALYIPITTDTPLIFFTVLSVAAFAVAVRRDSARHYLLAGALLGCAFLSKYFAALLGFAYLVFALVSPPREGRVRGVLLAFLAAVPFVALNLWWNYNHCWANVLHNFYNRHYGAALSWRTPLLYAVLVLYVLGPVLAWQLVKERGRLREAWSDPGARLFAAVALVPLALFAALSPWKDIGLHWVLSFVPLVFLLAGRFLTARELAASAKFLGAFSALHVVAAAAFLALPVETWRGSGMYSNLVLNTRPREVMAALEPYRKDHVLAAEGYAPAVTLGLASGTELVVFGAMSHHSRQYDFRTDMRALEGKDLAILARKPDQGAMYAPFFRESETREIEVRGARFYLVLGHGFDFEAYRRGILEPTRDRLYRIPWFLPQGGCPFCERYFGSPVCPAGNQAARR